MSKPEFEVGDLVYCPTITNKIVELKKRRDVMYCFGFSCNGVMHPYTADGKFVKNHAHQSIFHATEENHALLEKLYGVEFEKPKPKTTPREIIKYLLTKQKYVLCQVSDYSEDDARKCKLLEVIVNQKEGGKVSYDDINNLMWYYAIPIDLQGNEITEIEV